MGDERFMQIVNKLQIAVLGQPDIRYNNVPLALGTRKALALVIYLVVEGGKHSRTQLSELFWPDSDAQHGHMSLRSIIRDLRSALRCDSPSGFQHLIVDRKVITIDTNPDLDVDLFKFQAAWLLATTSAQIKRGSYSDIQSNTLEQLRQATLLYRGDFLTGFTLPDAPEFDDWVRHQREQWHWRMHQVFEHLSILYETLGQEEHALETILSWLALDPLYEEANMRLMRVHMAAGHRVAALHAYEEYQARLWEEQHVQPTSEMTMLVERIRGTKSSIYTPNSSVLSFKPDAAQLERLEGPLWGRKSEFKRLKECFQQARRGQAQIILVEGEEGIGKTRLIQEWLYWASMQGAIVLVSGAYKAGGRLPYQPIIELLRRHMEAENAPEDLLTDVWLTEISRLLPELRERYPDLPSPVNDASTTKNRLYESIARLIQAWAQRAPLVLFVDNIQWADKASLDLFHYLARFWQEQQTPACLVFTQCHNELTQYSTQLDWYQELKRIIPLSRLVLQAFTFDETQRFLCDLLKRKYPMDEIEQTHVFSDQIERDVTRLGQWLFNYTHGQPFYMLEILNSLVDLGILKRPLTDDGVWQIDMVGVSLQEGIVPASVSMLVESRVNSLSSAGKDLVAIAAMLGHGVTFEQFHFMSGAEQADTLRVLDEVINSGLLCLLSHQPQKLIYGFKHEIIQRAVYAGLNESRKRLLHQRILLMLESEQVSYDELVYHVPQSNPTEDAFYYN